MKKYFIVLCASLFLFACGNGKKNEPEKNDVFKGSVSGFVTDGITGAIIEDAIVSVQDNEISTGTDGSYVIEKVDIGDKTITASKTGYDNYSSTVTIIKGQQTSHDISLSPGEHNIPTNGLVAYYPFDGNADDLSGNKNHGKEFGGVSYVDSDNGNALKLDGTTGYVRITNPKQKFDKELTIAVKITTALHWGQIISKYSWNGSALGFSLIVTNDVGSGGVANGTALYGIVTDNDPWVPTRYPSYKLTADKETSVVFTYGNSTSRLYINGELKEEKVQTTIDNLDNSYDILLGTYFESNGASIVLNQKNYQGFKGLIDELRIYNKALTENEISKLY